MSKIYDHFGKAILGLMAALCLAIALASCTTLQVKPVTDTAGVAVGLAYNAAETAHANGQISDAPWAKIQSDYTLAMESIHAAMAIEDAASDIGAAQSTAEWERAINAAFVAAEDISAIVRQVKQ
ncbi:MAG: hypothetical protein HQK89_17810 [Nitrospirae bacterium]|nr:hypothetical protein [Nitrospirota bacterium]